MIRILSLVFSIIWCNLSYSSDLSRGLNKIDKETLSAEMWALNCIKMAQKDKIIIPDCYQANRLINKIDKQSISLIDRLTQDSHEDGPQFYNAMKKLKS